MIPILTSDQIREVDAYTIESEPIASIDLMERASHAFVRKFEELADPIKPIKIFCGTGNNGGDGLAIARILIRKGKHPEVYVAGNPEKGSGDFKTNLKALIALTDVHFISETNHIINLSLEDQIIDGLFGSGLTRPVSGIYGRLIDQINASEASVFSIDIASGLYTNQAPDGPCINPDYTISFQLPKLTFFQPQLALYVGALHLVSIGLNPDFISKQSTSSYLTEESDITSILKIRSRFLHKGEAGRMTLIGGSKGKMGACILAGRAAIRSGVGLLQIHTPQCGYEILQTSVPEAMARVDSGLDENVDFQLVPENQTVAIGPGLGTHPDTLKAFISFLENWKNPIVIDADAINLLALMPDLIDRLPKESILTPHPGEFERLTGPWKDDFEKLDKLRELARKHRMNIVLKGAYSIVANSEGKLFFNPTGNPGMATGGSGDVLTGIIGSLLAQGYSPFQSLKTGVYLHGLAGDLAKEKVGENALIASDLIDHLGAAFKFLGRLRIAR